MIACAGGFVISAGAASQEVSAERNVVIHEVVVTAQKREQRALDVPLTVNVLSEETISDANIVEFEDVVTLTPGLEFSSSLGRQTGNIVIRGIAPTGFTSEDTVLVYVDGFTLGFSRVQNNAQYFGLERIEVLKGPQGTLYGRNSLGGVINLVTKKPGDGFESWARASYGNYDAYDVGGSLSGPIVSERLSMGVAARYSERDGYWDNIFTGKEGVNGESDEAAQFQLHATPSERATIDLTLAYSASDDDCGDCPNNPVPGYSAADRGRVGRGEVNFNAPADTVNQDVDGSFEREAKIATVNANFDLGYVALNSITGYGDTDALLLSDLVSAPGPAFGVIRALSVERTSEVYSQELRLSSAMEGRVQWLVGLFGYRAELGRFSTVLLTVPPGSRPSTNSIQTVENYAAFGNVDYQFADHWSLGLGLRWDHEKVESDDRLAAIRFRDKSGDELLPKVSLSYQPSADVHVYASAARGYRSGGFNNFESVTVPRSFDAEYVRHYELGLKGIAAQGRVRYDLAAYFIDWQDRHSLQVTPIGQEFIINFGETTATGFEGAISLSPLEGLTVDASVSLMDSELKGFIDTSSAPAVFGWDPDYSGNSLPIAPDISASVSGQFIRPLASGGWDLRLRADARYTGEREFHESGVVTQDPYTLVNAYAGIQNERWQIGVFADNLFDEEYHSSGFISTALGPVLYRGDPRTYGVRLRADF